MSSKKTSFDDDFEAFLKGGDAELSALYAKLPQAEPDAKLDAAVLAMAHRALNAHLVATPGSSARPSAARRRARWLPALSAAATAVFAIGVAVKMGPQWAERGAQAPAASSTPAERDNGVVHVRPIDAPAAPPPPASPPPPPSLSTAAPKQEAMRAAPKPAVAAPPPQAPPAQKSAPAAEAPALRAETELAGKQLEKVENVAAPAAAPAAAPEPFPAQPARQPEMDSVERKQAIAEGAWQRLHDADGLGAVAGSSVAKPAVQAPQAATATAPPAAKLEEQRAAAPAGGRADGFAQQAPAAASIQAAPSRPAPAKSAPTTGGADSNAEREKLDTVTVTGSNIRRDDIQTASPVITIDRAKVQDEKPADDKFKGAGIGLKRGYSSEVLRNSHLYPEAWMAAIQRLIRAGRVDEARQNLELFSVKYPKYRLPDEVERFARDTR